MKSLRILMCAVLLCSGLLVFGLSPAGAAIVLPGDPLPAGDSDGLAFTMDGTQQVRFISEGGGESVGEEIDFTIDAGSPLDNLSTTFAYLVEPNQPYTTNTDGTVTGYRSDQIQLSVSHESGAPTTTISVTMNSDQDPGTHNTVTGYLETGKFQDITTALFGSALSGSGHTAQVLAASDEEAVPVPPSALLLGSGLLGLVGIRKFGKS